MLTDTSNTNTTDTSLEDELFSEGLGSKNRKRKYTIRVPKPKTSNYSNDEVREKKVRIGNDVSSMYLTFADSILYSTESLNPVIKKDDLETHLAEGDYVHVSQTFRAKKIDEEGNLVLSSLDGKVSLELDESILEIQSLPGKPSSEKEITLVEAIKILNKIPQGTLMFVQTDSGDSAVGLFAEADLEKVILGTKSYPLQRLSFQVGSNYYTVA